jgi:hypothetical protein
MRPYCNVNFSKGYGDNFQEVQVKRREVEEIEEELDKKEKRKRKENKVFKVFRCDDKMIRL